MGHKPAKHYQYNPSGSDRWIVCPFAAQPDLPDQQTEHTIRGNRLHTLAAYSLTDGLPVFGAGVDQQSVRQYVSFVQALAGEKFIERELVSAIVPNHGGTADAIEVTPNTIHVVDYKSGKGKVKAAFNPQGGCYLNLAREQYPDRKTFRFTVVQPSVYKKPQTAEFTTEWLDNHLQRVIKASTSQEKVTGSHCFFCTLRKCGRCPEGETYAQLKDWAA